MYRGASHRGSARCRDRRGRYSGDVSREPADPSTSGLADFWRAGSNSDEILDLAVQPDPSLPIHIAGEVFSRAGAWVEAALMSARLVETRLLA